MTQTTLSRLLESVFSDGYFTSDKNKNSNEEINNVLERLPFSLSKSQKTAILRALQEDISYIQGPPGTGKSFTISALSIAARELGLKVLVASQKTPAVDIVHQKLTDVLGKSSCLYLSNSVEKRKNMRSVIQDLMNNALDSMNKIDEREETNLRASVKDIVETRIDYLKKIRLYESELRIFYDLNNEAVQYRDDLMQNWEVEEKLIRKIKKIKNKKSILKLNSLIQKCEQIRETARKGAGKLPLSEVIKLKIISTSILKELNFDKNEYLKHKEELLKSVVKYSQSLAKAEEMREKVKLQPLEQIRKSFNWQSEKIYTKDINDSIFSKYLSIRQTVHANRLLKNKNYRKTLDTFSKRLGARNRRRIKEYNSKIDFNNLFDVFQVIMGEIKSLHAFLPFEEELFDLLILDEASQVNLAEIFPVLFRAKRFCIVGDHKQLGISSAGGAFVSKVYEKFTWEKYFSNLPKYPINYKKAEEKDILVSRSSILNLIRNPDNPIDLSSNLLDEHFRSLPMLAEFTNDQFYKRSPDDIGLKIMTALPDKKAINAFRDVPVGTERELIPNSKKKNNKTQLNKGEVEKSFEIVESFIKSKPIKLTEEVFQIPELKNRKISIGILSFTREQVNFMRSEAEKRFTSEEIKESKLMIGTPEEFQGNEKDVMIFAPSLDADQKMSKAHMENPNRFNVATSRAKYFMFFVHGQLPSNMVLMQKMITKMGQGKMEIREDATCLLPSGMSLNPSKCQSEFEHQILDILSKLIEKEFPNRLQLFNQVKASGYFLDFVIYDQITKKIVAIEPDGKHHFYADDETYTDDHMERDNCLKRAGWIVKHLPYWDFYENGWLPDDHPPVEELRNFVRDFFDNNSENQ